jgi:phosphoribosylformylglycinamidine cyclo-ligase
MPAMTDPLTYRDAGVDIDAGNEAVRRIKRIVSARPRRVAGGEDVGGIGGFSALFRPHFKGYKDPLLVSSTDGVGTKLLIALEHNRMETIGQDLVGMIVNDIIVTGARPLFFLDYIATGKLDPAQIETIVASIQAACEESDCLLVGGECAEMPGMYAPGHTDLAGFGVGIVDRERVINGSMVESGDIVLGLASNGFHSNGFSLVRKVIEKAKLDLGQSIAPGQTLLDAILKPTRLYVRPILALIEQLGDTVKACSHITGGGLLENLPRVLPDNLAAELHRDSWKELPVFELIREKGNVPEEDMDRTFNRGIGFMVVVSEKSADAANLLLVKTGETVYKIGRIIERHGEPKVVIK